jgi:hypothetical protein
MESLLTEKLKVAGFREVDVVTRNSCGDCMFLCFLHAMKAYIERGVNHARGILYTEPYPSIEVPLPTHRTRPIADREFVDVSTVAGLRRLVVDATTAILSDDTPEKQRTTLLKHILHRFKSSVMRSRDAEVQGYEPPADHASENDLVAAWKGLMQSQGMRS